MILPGHFFLILLSVLLRHTTAQIKSHCNSLSTCSECISSPMFPCAWCKNKEYVDMFFPPCDVPSSLLVRGCPQDDVFTAEEDLSIVDGSGGSVSPSKAFAPIRPTSRQSFEITVTPPINLPVDVYMLFDNTHSMDPYIDIAKLISVRLLRFMQNVSNASRIGFGTFVDKETIPFHFNQGGKKDFPGVSRTFKNIRSLTGNKNVVTSSLRNFTTGTNDDQPEGVLEAIVQAVTCNNSIRWSPQFSSYRMLVVMTDAEYHYALDGRLAGIVTPNDLECKVKGDTYENSGDQDYPSILQLLDLLLHENILPIMITDGDLRELYEELFGLIGIENTTVVLTTDSNGLLNTVQNIYTEASTSAIPFVAQEADIIMYNLEVLDCGGGVYVAETKSCIGIKPNSKATYRLEVWLDPEESCRHGHRYEHNLDLHFLAFGSVVVSLLPICECNCSATPGRTDSPECSYQGMLSCGVCVCNEGFSGPACNCTADSSLQSCIAPGADTVCSNKGQCNCGVCSCYDSSSFGEFCECETNRCPFYNGEICGGPIRGTCGCSGVCSCTEDYENGIDGVCSCPKQGTAKAVEQCSNPDNPYHGLCSGHGRCVCGMCDCDDGGPLENRNYEGKYCEICNLCDNSCALLRPCLSCLFSTGNPSCCNGIPGDSIKRMDPNITTYVEVIQDRNFRICTLFDLDGCIWDYVIPANLTGNERDIEVLARRRACSTATWWPWVVGAFLIVAVTGIIVIIVFRIAMRLIEKKEFDKFSESQKRDTVLFTESPLYNPPVTETDNPGYRKIVSQD